MARLGGQGLQWCLELARSGTSGNRDKNGPRPNKANGEECSHSLSSYRLQMSYMISCTHNRAGRSATVKRGSHTNL